MTKEYIKEQIEYYTHQIKDDFDSNTFTLNSQAAFCREQIAFFQSECDHKNINNQFALNDDARCIYCGKKIQE